MTQGAYMLDRPAALRALRDVVRQVQRSRLPVRVRLEPHSADAGCIGFSAGVERDVAAEIGADVYGVSHAYPLFGRLYERFRGAMPAPKVVRFDDEASYADFLERRRAPYLDRLARLEVALAAHVADGHGLPPTPEAQVLGGEVERAADRVACAGEPIRLSLAPWAPRVRCWQDGGEIVCSVLFADRGRGCVATTGVPVARYVDEAVLAAAAAEVEPEIVAGVLPALEQVLGGGALVDELGLAIPAFLRTRRSPRWPAFGRIVPAGDPLLAAAMYLRQLCMRGDRRACIEAARIASSPRGRGLLMIADERLARAREVR